MIYITLTVYYSDGLFTPTTYCSDHVVLHQSITLAAYQYGKPFTLTAYDLRIRCFSFGTLFFSMKHRWPLATLLRCFR